MASFKQIVEENQRHIFYLAYDLTGNRQDAEDLSQEVFMKAYKSWQRFRGEAKIATWLHRITINTWIDMSRKKSYNTRKLHESYDADNLPSGGVFENPEKKMESEAIQQDIRAALDCLSPRERSVFVLRHYQQYPLKEIAKTLKISTGTVKSQLFRAVQKLQKALDFYRKDIGLEQCNE